VETAGWGGDLDVVRAPLLASGAILAVDRARGLLALDAVSGHERWHVRTTPGWGDCVVDSGQVLATLSPGRLAVIEAHTGTVLDEAAVEGLLLADSFASDGRIVGKLSGGDLGAWDVGRRAFAWRRPSDAAVPFPVAAGDGVLCFASRDGFAACDLLGGTDLWRVPFGTSEPSTHPIVYSGVMYGGLTGGRVVAVDVGTGESRWQTNVGWSAGVQIDMLAGRALVVVAGLELISLDPGSGAVLGRGTIRHGEGIAGPTVGRPGPISVSRDHVWSVDSGGHLLALDPGSGLVAFYAELGAIVVEPPLIGDGAVFVVDFDGGLHALFAQRGADTTI
jgi:outer membrane protein assembly factor BamB